MIVPSARDLGVIFDSDLPSSNHIFCTLYKSLTIHDARCITHQAPVIHNIDGIFENILLYDSNLDYCNSLM